MSELAALLGYDESAPTQDDDADDFGEPDETRA
jgi:hypothetical protein